MKTESQEKSTEIEKYEGTDRKWIEMIAMEVRGK
jgi:hypothetical protein